MHTSIIHPRNLAKYLLFAGLCLSATFAAAQKTEDLISIHPLTDLIEESPVFSNIFTGFALYDPDENLFLYEKDIQKYFTPASNTKLFTFYTALQVLGDSIPALRYVISGDTLVFWGTGNPLFLHPELPQDTTVFNFLKRQSKQLFFSPHNFEDERFGPGWSWRDYQYSYQVEKSPFPLYGNMVCFERKRTGEGFGIYPFYFRRHMVFNPEMDTRRPDVRRLEHSNTFEYNAPAMTGFPFERQRPFRYTPATVAGLLSDTLHVPVGVLNLKEISPKAAHTLHIPVPDTLYRRLMQKSDNFIAEQLLLLVSEKLFGVQNTEQAIEYAKDSLFQDMPDKLVWVDGSGLSRYNLFTPRSIVRVLHKIYHVLPRERLLNIFPAGGVSGTIEQWYAGSNGRPYVFAKTGTLSNKHALSGYLFTRKGKLLIFSFMHNNYINGADAIKKEMEKVLEWIYQNY
jgi:D-alanyl-D-alanine carboxypeptidase/D-alanyl-D-alanine-endopeptidase (penicillin-binding protein 4)